MGTSIILIGPLGAGKTTLMRLLAERLGWMPLDLDDLRWAYYAEIGYDEGYAKQLRDSEDWFALGRYWKPFEAHSVERVVADYPENHVIAFGAGHSVYDDPELLARVQTALAPFPVVLLMPAADVDETLAITRARIAAKAPEIPEANLDLITTINRGFAAHPANGLLAKHTVFTHDQTPEQTCEVIYGLWMNPV